VVGATGLAGQQVLAALAGHPWFRLEAVSASERSMGMTLGEALFDRPTGRSHWFAEGEPPEEHLRLPVLSPEDLAQRSLDLIFSAVERDVAEDLEPRLALHTPVVSTASAFRQAPDVPILVPGVNGEHLPALRRQQEARGWRGFIAPIPNCTTTGLVVSLRPLQQAFGIRAVAMTSMQAVSGAGRGAGVLALDVLDNLIPFIPDEEEKVERETRKILGAWDGGQFAPASFAVSSTCTRVNVRDGHTEAVFVATAEPADVAAAQAAMRAFGAPGVQGLPSAPSCLLRVLTDPYRPQPRRDRDAGGGMTVTVGRIRADAVLGGLKYVVVSHNTKLGAGKGAVLLAEWLTREGYVDGAG